LKLTTYEFYKYIAKDKEAFDKVIEAFRMPEGGDDEKKHKKEAIQNAFKHAAQVPFEVCKKILLTYPYAKILAQKGLKNAISDVGVALYSLRSGFMGARVNVLINLNSIADKKFNKSLKIQLDSLRKQEEAYYQEIENLFLTKL
jgi:formiminotetrahydrofolate cyclodeaminase